MDDGEVVLVVLAEAHTGVEDDLIVGDAGFLGDRKAAAHILAEFIEEIVVFRLLAVVHQAAGDLVLRDEIRHLAVVLEAPDVVDKVSARLERLRYHRAFVAVDGNRDVEFLLDHLDDGNDTVDFLLHADLHMAGTGGLAAHVHNGRALGDHIGRVAAGIVQIVPASAVGEGVRGHIQNTHNEAVVLHIKKAIANFHHRKWLLMLVMSYFSFRGSSCTPAPPYRKGTRARPCPPGRAAPPIRRATGLHRPGAARSPA